MIANSSGHWTFRCDVVGCGFEEHRETGPTENIQYPSGWWEFSREEHEGFGWATYHVCPNHSQPEVIVPELPEEAIAGQVAPDQPLGEDVPVLAVPLLVGRPALA